MEPCLINTAVLMPSSLEFKSSSTRHQTIIVDGLGSAPECVSHTPSIRLHRLGSFHDKKSDCSMSMDGRKLKFLGNHEYFRAAYVVESCSHGADGEILRALAYSVNLPTKGGMRNGSDH